MAKKKTLPTGSHFPEGMVPQTMKQMYALDRGERRKYSEYSPAAKQYHNIRETQIQDMIEKEQKRAKKYRRRGKISQGIRSLFGGKGNVAAGYKASKKNR